jgi:hypothetical protein
MANLADTQLTIKINTTGIPLLIKLLFIPVHIWSLWLWLKCKITKRLPLKITIDIETKPKIENEETAEINPYLLSGDELRRTEEMAKRRY